VATRKLLKDEANKWRVLTADKVVDSPGTRCACQCVTGSIIRELTSAEHTSGPTDRLYFNGHQCAATFLRLEGVHSGAFRVPFHAEGDSLRRREEPQKGVLLGVGHIQYLAVSKRSLGFIIRQGDHSALSQSRQQHLARKEYLFDDMN
jgi:hypothetical protein